MQCAFCRPEAPGARKSRDQASPVPPGFRQVRLYDTGHWPTSLGSYCTSATFWHLTPSTHTSASPSPTPRSELSPSIALSNGDATLFSDVITACCTALLPRPRSSPLNWMFNERFEMRLTSVSSTALFVL